MMKYDPVSGWFGQQGIAPGVFMGVGQRLVPLGAPGAEDHNNRPVGDLAGMSTQSFYGFFLVRLQKVKIRLFMLHLLPGICAFVPF